MIIGDLPKTTVKTKVNQQVSYKQNKRTHEKW